MSAPCRGVYMTCDVLGLDPTIKMVDLFKGESRTPEYLKMNPQHTVPTVVDNGYVITESRAALTYLVDKYAKGNQVQLYPRDLQARTKIDQLLYFDIGTYYKAFAECCYPILLGPQRTLDPVCIERMHEVLGWFRDKIKPTGFVAGTDHLTLADISFVSSTTTIIATGVFDLSGYPEIMQWLERCKALIPNYKNSCGDGANLFGTVYQGAYKGKQQSNQIQVYGTPVSAPCRMTFMACEVLGIDYKIVNIDLMKGETRTPEYLKMNIKHTVPTVKDGDMCITESRPAATYLADRYAKDDKMYPKAPEERVKVDQMLYFDMGTYYKAFGDCVYPILLGPAKNIDADKMTRLHEVLGWMKELLKDGFAAGTNMTLADLSLMATTSALIASEIVDMKKYPEIMAWYDRCMKQIPNYNKVCGEGGNMFGAMFKKAFAAKQK